MAKKKSRVEMYRFAGGLLCTKSVSARYGTQYVPIKGNLPQKTDRSPKRLIRSIQENTLKRYLDALKGRSIFKDTQ